MNIEEVKTNTNNGKMWQLVDACLESGKFPRQLVDSAVDLILFGAVNTEEGRVSSLTTERQSYDTNLVECSCPAFKYQSGPCKHIVALGLTKLMEKDMATNQPSIFEGPQFNDDDIPEEFQVPNNAPEPEPEPAPVASSAQANHAATVFVEHRIGNTKIGWTIRADNDEDAWDRMKMLLAKFEGAAKAYAEKHPEKPASGDAPYCDKHGVYFREYSNDRGSWFSHKMDDDKWCHPPKGR